MWSFSNRDLSDIIRNELSTTTMIKEALAPVNPHDNESSEL